MSKDLLYWQTISKITPDGSLRTFIRGYFKDLPAIMIKPAHTEEGIKEAQAFYNIGTHLIKRKINIPKIYYFDEETGILIVEDLGDTLIEKIVTSKGHWDTTFYELYKNILRELLRFQIVGEKGFDYNWCFDTTRYDFSFALEREGFYFLEYLIYKFFNLHISRALRSEVTKLFMKLNNIKVYYGLMHRDFQSRNIIFNLQRNKIYIIDFQGARLGPLCYDLASLLHDPYVMMPIKMVDKLKRFYITNLKQYISISEVEFERQFRLLSVFRLMQALGAFAKLTLEFKKIWFKNYISHGITRLIYCLSFEDFDEFNLIKQLLYDIHPD